MMILVTAFNLGSLLHVVGLIQTALDINPFVLSYVYIRTKSQNRCDSCTYIYVHGLYDQNMGLLPASNRHFTVSPQELFTSFRSVASISQHVYQVRRKVEFVRSCPLFLANLENYDCRTKLNSSLGMEYNRELYGFSAVKVKLVDSLI